MRYTISINQVKTREWGLNMNEGALMDLINQAYSWAEPVMIDGKLYYWMSRNKVIAEIPSAYAKPDTVYRAFKTLAEKGLVYYTKQGKRDLLSLTAKGKTWNVEGTVIGDAILGYKSDLIDNSEIDPSKSGNKSENNSDRNPTYKNTSINKSTNNKNRATSAPDDFSANEKQIDKMAKYGLLQHDQELLIESFLANSTSKGLTYKCWTSAFTTWINNEIKFQKLVPVANMPAKQKGALDDWNARNPDYQPPSQQPDVYHPSQKSFEDPAPSTLAIGDNGYWKDPLPGKSIAETEQYLKDNKRPGENTYGAYKRLLANLQEQGL